MHGFFALLLLMEPTSFYGCDFKHFNREVALSRKKRYLNFPVGSVAVLRNIIKSET
jgi:hypothetical protein